MTCLIDNPDQQQLVRAEPDLVPAAVDRTSEDMPPIPTPAFFGVTQQKVRLSAS